MKPNRSPRTWRRGTLKSLQLSLFILILAILIVKFTVWFYQNYRQGLGYDLAQIAIAYHAVLFLGMLLLGLGLGYGVEWLVLQRKFMFYDSQPDSLAEWIVTLWGIERPPLKTEPEESGEPEPLDLQKSPWCIDTTIRKGAEPLSFRIEAPEVDPILKTTRRDF